MAKAFFGFTFLTACLFEGTMEIAMCFMRG